MAELCDHPCVLFALEREAAPFLRRLHAPVAVAGAPRRAVRGLLAPVEVVVVETGVGAAAMTRSLNWLLETPIIDGRPYRPRFVLSAGFSGALNADLKVGDLVLAREIFDLAGGSWPTTWPAWPPEDFRLARLLCHDQFIAEPARKLELGQRHQAAAVDMESAVCARFCAEHGVLFGCLRVISDDVHVPLSPAIFELIEGERVAFGRLARLLFKSPSIIGQLLRLARQTRLAARQLAEAIERLLRQQ